MGLTNIIDIMPHNQRQKDNDKRNHSDFEQYPRPLIVFDCLVIFVFSHFGQRQNFRRTNNPLVLA
jgi:hypothetical protein